jgi:YbbR domain-containing protein
MQNRPTLRRTLITNLLWFLGSLVLAFFVWLFATSQADPFVQWRQPNLPIHLMPDDGLIITNQNAVPGVAAAQLRAPQSVRQLFASDDIIISANLAGLGPGQHVVPLQWDIARQASVVDISPRQVTVELEVLQSQLKPVTVDIIAQPPMVYSMGEPVLDMRQVEVSGPASSVGQIAEVVASVSLDGQRSNFEGDVRVTPVDIDGNTVTGVTLDPQIVHVSIAIEPRSGVREVRVQPNIVGELPDGYVHTGEFDYNPKTIVVSGPETVLNNLPASISTAPIDLSDKTSSFEVTVPVELPDDRLVVVTGRAITVSVGIDTQTITRQFDHIAVEFVGGRIDLEYSSVNNEVTVLLTGPQPLLSQLTENDLSVLVDVSNLEAGESEQIAPIVSLLDSNVVVTSSVLPAQIDVEARTARESTPEPGSS